MNTNETKPETVGDVGTHIRKVVEYIEKQYPGAKYLDAAPILRNMRRWADRIDRAHAAGAGRVPEALRWFPRPGYSDEARMAGRAYANGWNNCRAVMLSAAPAPDPKPAPEADELDAIMRARGLPKVADALGFSRNFAAANPNLSQTTRDHIEGLCSMLEIAAAHPAPQPPAEPAAQPAPSAAQPRCTCPSGDGSLRWPCPTHPPEPAAQAETGARIEQCCNCGKRFDASEGQGDGAELTDGRWACSEACWDAAVGPADEPAPSDQPAETGAHGSAQPNSSATVTGSKVEVREGASNKEAWWAGARAGLGVPAGMPRKQVAKMLATARTVKDVGGLQPATAKPAGDAEFKVGDRVKWVSDESGDTFAGTVRGHDVGLDHGSFVDCALPASLTRLTGGSHD